MSKIKETMYHYLDHRTELEECVHTPENHDIWQVAERMLTTINELEWELALYKTGLSTYEIEQLRRVEPPLAG